ncbi:DEAD/DEAH box helicase [Okibacterium fritillariae]|uniref:DEAD/DEAH box helicase n=1 Tax=Okibacterium fritillariae TaxID=123320 RepID=UPI00405554B7
MPKKKPVGGRPAKNYDPNYAAKRPAGKPGSRSEGHRGFRAADPNAPKKARWNADERAAKHAGRYSDEPRAKRSDDDRAPRSFDRDDRAPRRDNDAPRSFNRDDRAPRRDNDAPRRFDRDDRAPRSFNRDDRAPRSFNRDDRAPRRDNDAPRRFDRDDRAPRSFNRDDRAPRSAGRDDRAPRSFNRDDRAPRSFNRDDRAPRRDNDAPRRFDRDDRAPRSFNRDDRAPRSAGRDDRAPRSFNRDDRAPRSFNRDDRAPRRDNDAPRSFNRDDRAPRSFNRDDRAPRRDNDAPRSFNRDDRAPRRDNDAPRRFDRDSKPAFRDDKPAFRDAKPPRTFTRDGRPENEGRASDFYPKRDAANRPGFSGDEDVVLERLEAQATTATDVEGVTFQDLGLGGNISGALAELGAASPFPIQAATIPDVLAGRDVLGRGRTGSGKTIAFGAPLVEKLMENGGGKRREMGRKPRALILAPTRELALQIDRTVQPIARSVGLFTTQIYGGVPQGRQVGALQRGVDIIIGTPGRIEDLIEQGRLDLSEVSIVVLDEADHMCDLGFLEPVQRIIRETASGNQKLLFSATLDKGVAALVNEFLQNPAVHEVAGEDQASSTIDHRVLVVEHRDKDQLIEQLADREEKTLIFARTRAYAERLTDQLEDAGIPAVALHGDLNQARRTRNLEKVTSGRVKVLVATDVAARGIHVDDITLVVQADAPDEYKTYLHRSGRTGRAGKEGVVVTLIPRSRQRRMTELLGRAEIEADFVEARPGDDIIEGLAGRMTLADITA